MYKLDKSTNAVFSLNYHFITVVKYRRKVFTNDEIVEYLKSVVEQVAEENNIINGDSSGNKMYKKYVTREEMAAMLHRANAVSKPRPRKRLQLNN